MARAVLILLLASVTFLSPTHAKFEIIPVSDYLNEVEAVVVGVITSVERRVASDGRLCGHRVKISVNEMLHGGDVIDEFGSFQPLEVGGLYIMFLRRGSGNYPQATDRLERVEDRLFTNCLAELPGWSNDFRLSAKIEYRFEGESSYAPMIKVGNFIELPEHIESQAMSFKIESLIVNGTRMNISAACYVLPLDMLLNEGRYLDWNVFRAFLSSEVKEAGRESVN